MPPQRAADDVLRSMYGEAPPPCPAPRAEPNFEDDASESTAHRIRPGVPVGSDMLLIDLPADLLMEVYAHIQLPCALKRVCWTLYRAGPTQLSLIHI